MRGTNAPYPNSLETRNPSQTPREAFPPETRVRPHAKRFLLDVVADDGVVSLREAIESANGLAGTDTITFAPTIDGQPIQLSAELGQLSITDSVGISGNGSTQTIVDANQQSRVLSIEGDAIDVNLSGLAVTGGKTTGSNEWNVQPIDDHGGGGIRFLSSGTLTATDSVLSANSTSGELAAGGGIFTSTGNVTLIRSTLSNNRTTGGFAYGGGVRSEFGVVTLIDSTVSDNHTTGIASDGGGISAGGGNVTLTGSTVSSNSTAGENAKGAGIQAYQGDVTVTESTISNNVTEGFLGKGGGIFAHSGKVTLTDSILSGNRTAGPAAGQGGGIYLGMGSGSATLLNSTLSGNSTSGADSWGGGIYSFGSSVTLTGSTLSGNRTTGNGSSGGGIASYGKVTLFGSTLSNNRADGTDSDGGGLWFGPTSVSIMGSTVTGNTASGTGGGLATPEDVYDRNLKIHNSIIAGNTARINSDLELPITPESPFDLKSSIIGDNEGTSLTASETADANGNLIGTPAALIDPLLGPLQDNGGLTLTHDLLPNSPAIDAGDNGLLAGQMHDQRGAAFTRTFNVRADIGAVEYVDPSIVTLPNATSSIAIESGDIVVRSADQVVFQSAIETLTRLRTVGTPGDDTIELKTAHLSDTAVLEVSGGPGENTLLVDVASLDLTKQESLSVENFSRIDLRDDRPNVLTLDARAVSTMSPVDKAITILGDLGIDQFVFSDVANWRMDAPENFDGQDMQVTVNQITGERVRSNTSSGWHNLLVPSDINNSGDVTASDALLIINELGRRAYSIATSGVLNSPVTDAPFPGNFYDQNSDGSVTSVDALRVINQLSRMNSRDDVPGEVQQSTDTFNQIVVEPPLGSDFVLRREPLESYSLSLLPWQSQVSSSQSTSTLAIGESETVPAQSESPESSAERIDQWLTEMAVATKISET
ncbi:Dockerin type I repeat protein [Rubripirellula tenax]|uniref:Dockerin type I repeat protein n=1 Tax=Rubripirellula tenax TaxID=2528015 RepID=A0A5C6F8D5_9BACT|nr:choice-of-anchor Q domain-containing protein [Rubripirellula tenax]TWU56617.1 Dockerin type I repeat protein [Rubripirellula tenax]